MRLSDFIEANVDPILASWVEFARTQGQDAQALDARGLRDHAVEMLADIVDDLREPQTPGEQRRKAEGKLFDDTRVSAAVAHGAGRARQGFTATEMVAEFRALRASVQRLYRLTHPVCTLAEQEGLMRFNEAVDQAVADSLARFTADRDAARDTVIAVLSHDLRTPLQSILMTAHAAVAQRQMDESLRAGMLRVSRSAQRMHQMIDMLLDFTQVRLGEGIVLHRTESDVGELLQHAVDEVTGMTPSNPFVVTRSGDLRGQWDTGRLAQVLANLLANAVQHGDAEQPRLASARGTATEVVLQVQNGGSAIAADDLAGLFQPFKPRDALEPPEAASHHLGLGLYIARSVVEAHGGRIEVTSSANAGTTVTVMLPR